MKPVILGMNNPLSERPEHALYPRPVGCTGHRLWKLLNKRTGASQEDYLDAFDRTNLVVGAWSIPAARANVTTFLAAYRGRTVLVLGAEPRKALRLPETLVHPIEQNGIVWRCLPHPSGRNPWYGEPAHRETAELLLEELYNSRETAQPREPLLL